jgi:hypothetical protein
MMPPWHQYIGEIYDSLKRLTQEFKNGGYEMHMCAFEYSKFSEEELKK